MYNNESKQFDQVLDLRRSFTIIKARLVSFAKVLDFLFFLV